MSGSNTEAKSTQSDGVLKPEDFAPSQGIQFDPAYFRQLIDGLRALPNVSDMAVIKTITELDRMAGLSEASMRKRELVFATALKLAEQWAQEGKLSAETVVLMKATGGVPPAIIKAILEDVFGPQELCQCDSCKARRQTQDNERNGATLQ